MLAIMYLGLTFGVGTSASCAAICTPILVPYIASSEHPTIVKGLSTAVLFSIGRLLSYLALGLVFGLLITSVEIDPVVTASITMLLGFLLVLHGLSTFGLFTMKNPLGSMLCRYISNKRSPVYLGIFTGLRPCIPLIAALTYTLTLASTTHVLLFMVSFWFGSSLLVLLIGPLSGALAGLAAKKITADRIRRIAGIAMFMVGIFFIIQSLGLNIYQISV